MWNSTSPIRSEYERQSILNIEQLIESNREAFRKYDDLGKQGEYSVKFLILLAKLLMV